MRFLVAGLVCIHSVTVLGGSLEPTTVFTQAGTGDQHTEAYVLGGTWDGPWTSQLRWATIGEYFEMEVGRWSTRADRVTSAAWPTQIGLTPVLRVERSVDSLWFGELGVGANYIVPLFRSGKKRFSTEFNFGDHAAVGRRFGPGRRLEVALRVEHFSNAGISHPNPGENFLQLRLSAHPRSMN
jgi:lipid A 3-O-deacylase